VKIEIDGKVVDWRMDPEAKKKWVEALRSGEYKQTQGTLFCPSNGGYCCLGVKADIMGLLVNDSTRNAGDKCVMDGTKRHTGGLPESILPGTIQDRLITLNDVQKWSFKRIASHIERYL
jgi:hypothetical protein